MVQAEYERKLEEKQKEIQGNKELLRKYKSEEKGQGKIRMIVGLKEAIRR